MADQPNTPQAERLPVIPGHEDEGRQTLVFCPKTFRIHTVRVAADGTRSCAHCGRKAV